MLYDCFLFCDELELLDVRLHELSDIVDHFVLVEATSTFSGRPKPLHFDHARTEFAAFEQRIVHVVVDDLPSGDAWTRERHQRNAVLRGLVGCRADDQVLLSDLDEIPRACIVERALHRTGIRLLQQSFYYYWLNCRMACDWLSPRLACYADVLRLSPTSLRGAEGEIVANGGWHFSFMGGVQRIQSKLRSFSHQEFNCPPYVDEDHIERAMANGTDLFGRPDMRFEFVPLDESYPRYILDHADRFAKWIRPVPRGSRAR